MSQTKFITLAPGKQEGDLPTTRLGIPSNVLLLKGKIIPVRPDDSREDGIGETLATRLVEDGRCMYCSETGDISDPEPAVTTSRRAKKQDASSEPDTTE